MTSRPDILSRWKDYYATLLNRPSESKDQILESIQQCPIRDELDELSTKREIEQVIASTANNKAAGLDGSPAEVCKHGGDTLVANLLNRYRCYWESGELPQGFKDALIVNIYKRKGDRQDCGNYRGISLLATTSKIFAKILFQRLLFFANDVLPEAQCGNSTIDVIFTLRQLQEKAAEQNKPLYIAFVDFSSVFSPFLWRLLSKFGCPDKLILMLRAFHVGMQAHVMIDGETTDAYKQYLTGLPPLLHLLDSLSMYEKLMSCINPLPGHRTQHRRSCSMVRHLTSLPPLNTLGAPLETAAASTKNCRLEFNRPLLRSDDYANDHRTNTTSSL